MYVLQSTYYVGTQRSKQGTRRTGVSRGVVGGALARGEGPLGVNVQAGGVELTQGGRFPPPASCSGGELCSRENWGKWKKLRNVNMRVSV